MPEQNWRTGTNAEDYFTHQQKAAAVADRRPVVRRAGDIVGPGIAETAIALDNFNDPLGMFNGYYAAPPEASNAPSNFESFIGIVVGDSELGGTQQFTGITTGKQYSRRFIRSIGDPNNVTWTAWVQGGDGIEVGFLAPYVGATPPEKWLICDGSTFSSGTYPTLAARLGSTTLPDLRDRTIYGVGTSWTLLADDGLATAARGKVLDHDHSIITDPGGSHTHSLGSATDGWTAATSGAVPLAFATLGHSHSVGSDGTHGHGGATWTGAYNGLPPKLRGVGMNWLVKAL